MLRMWAIDDLIELRIVTGEIILSYAAYVYQTNL